MIAAPATTAAPAQAAPQRQSAGDSLVLAFYYAWYDSGVWTYDRLSDLPAEPYASRDRGAMGRHIDQARRAGIDALLLAWYGPGGPNQTEDNLAAMLDEAAARGFKIGVLFETDSPFFSGQGDVTSALQHLLSVHAAHPAYLRVDGRPVIFFWRPGIYGVDTWRSIRAQSDPGNTAVWIGEGTDTGLLAVFDGHHLYSNTWNPPADLSGVNRNYAARVQQAQETFGATKLWVATVMPGYNDVRIRADGFARDRESGNYYAQAWQAALDSQPHWIVVNSFNEWPEGSYIEPSAAYGDAYLDLTAAWAGQFKGRGGTPSQFVAPAPVAAPSAVAAAAPVAVVAAAPTPAAALPPTTPTAFVETALLNVRGGPSTEHPILGQVAAGQALPITGRQADLPDWWQVDYAGAPAWVYAPLVTAAGPLDQVPLLAEATAPLPAPPPAVNQAASVPLPAGYGTSTPSVPMARAAWPSLSR
jgi:uncharacterized protein YraI